MRRHTGRQAYSGLGADSGVLTSATFGGKSACTVDCIVVLLLEGKVLGLHLLLLEGKVPVR